MCHPSSLWKRTREGGGMLTGNCGLLGLSVKPCGCFPSSAVSPELLRLVLCRADRVSRRASWLPVVICDGSRGYNPCQATWRFGLDWSFSAPGSQQALSDTVGPLHTHGLRSNIYLKGKCLRWCIALESGPHFKLTTPCRFWVFAT